MKRFLFFSLIICPISLFADGGLPDKPYIYVEGKAEIQKPADMAIGVGPSAGAVEVERMIEAGPQYRLAPITVSQSVHVIHLISPVK